MVDVENGGGDDVLLRTSRRPEGPEVGLLRLLCEQNAATVGQLVRWFGTYRGDMERLLREYEDLGWLYREQFLVGDDIWVWLSKLGDRLAGVGFTSDTPSYESLAHWGAINDARIYVESHFKNARWICERRLRSMQGGTPRGYLVDAMVFRDEKQADGSLRRRTYGIEVELSKKTEAQLRHKLTMNSKRFDLLIYFAVPEICEVFDKKGFLEEFPKLRVYRIPAVNRALDQPLWRVEGDPQPFKLGRRQKVRVPDLSETELDALDFLSEQGMAPMDQLERSVGFGAAETERMVVRWLAAGLAERAAPLVDQPAWVWLTTLGAKKSRLGLRREVPRLGALERARAVNEIRLRLTSGKKGIEWIGRSRRRREGKGFGPVAVVRINNQEHAVDLWTSTGDRYDFERRVGKRFSEGFVGLVWFYSEGARTEVLKFVRAYGSKRLRAEEVPEGAYLGISPAAKKARIDLRGRSRNSSSSLGPIGPELWKRLAAKGAAESHPVVIESIPSEALSAIADSAGAEKLPTVSEGWVEIASLRVMWLVSELGFYRVSHSGWGWHADEVEREDVFIVDKNAPAVDLRERRVARRGRKFRFFEPKHHEMSNDVWMRVRPLIPAVEERSARSDPRTMSDRAVLSALIWKIRTGRGWEHLADYLEHGSWAAVYYRFRSWEETGVWAKVKEVLTGELHDGADLDWSLAEASGRSPFNRRQRQLLERMMDDPGFAFTFDSYREGNEVTQTTATKDLTELAESWLVIGTREGRQGFVFRPAADLAVRFKRLTG
jgi:transposase